MILKGNNDVFDMSGNWISNYFFVCNTTTSPSFLIFSAGQLTVSMCKQRPFVNNVYL